MAKNITKDSAAQETLANLISSIAANAIGAAAGGESGASAAANADKYNRQLHPEEWEWLQDVENQKKFVEYVCENEPSLCADGALPNIVAEAILLRQALRQVDFSWRYFLGNEQGRIDELASDFLLNSGKTIKSTFGTNKAFVAANDAEYLDYRKYLEENKPYLNDLRLFTAGFMRQDTSVAKLQLLMLVASIYGADNIGMGPLPGDNKADYEAILKDAFHEARRTIPMISAGQIISDMKEILSAVEYYKNNGCDGDIDCAIGKAQVEPLIDSISRKYKKFAETGKDDLELLDKVYNNHYMSVGQIGEDLAQVAILLATKKIADKTAKIKANKNKLDQAIKIKIDEKQSSKTINVNSEPRQLKAEDLGLPPEKIKQLNGTISKTGETLNIRIDMIESDRSLALYKSIKSFINIAEKTGATEIKITASLANDKLLKFLQKNTNFTVKTSGGTETITINLKKIQ